MAYTTIKKWAESLDMDLSNAYKYFRSKRLKGATKMAKDGPIIIPEDCPDPRAPGMGAPRKPKTV